MTPLRAKMIRELELHRKAPKTIEAYVRAVARLSRFYGRSPEKISLEEIRDFLHHLIAVRKVAYSTCNQKPAGIRFCCCWVSSRTAARFAARCSTASRCCPSLRPTHRLGSLPPPRLRCAARLSAPPPQQEDRHDALPVLWTPTSHDGHPPTRPASARLAPPVAGQAPPATAPPPPASRRPDPSPLPLPAPPRQTLPLLRPL